MCRWCSSTSIRRADNSGSTTSAAPVRTSSSIPGSGVAVSISLVSSSVTRSADTIDSRPAISRMAAWTPSSTANPRRAANRAARKMRSGSSEKESSGRPGVLITRSRSAARPPNGSTSSNDGSRAAIALIVKSRRSRSAVSDLPYRTSGLRDVRS